MISYPYREKEIEELRRQLWLSQNDGSRMSLVYGHHFLGKSAAVSAALAGTAPVVCLSLGGKNDTLALEEYKHLCSKRLGIFVPYSIASVEELINFLFDEAWKRPFSLVIDNFQEAPKRYPELCRHLAKKWKSEAKHTKLNLVIVCAEPRTTEELFFTGGAPLRNLAGASFSIKPLSLERLKAIQNEAADGQPLSAEDYLAFYLFTGGRPKAVQCALSLGAVTKAALMEAWLKEDSPLVNLSEKKLYSLLGKNSDTYLSILQLIATGVCSQAEIEQKLGGIIIGGHLAKLENEYQFIRKERPLLSAPDSRGVVRYHILDPSFTLFFRLACADGGVKNEKEASAVLEKYQKEDLKDYFLEKFQQSGLFSAVGSDWAATARISKKKGLLRDASKDEPSTDDSVDIVALKGKKAMVAAVCPTAESFNKETFLQQVESLKKGLLKDYSIDARLFTLKDL